MHIQWCLKGIAESTSFSDTEATAAFDSGLSSNRLRQNAHGQLDLGLTDLQWALSVGALFDHVNDYARVRHSTPYISLSAGIVQPDSFGYVAYPAWFTAVDFATQAATTNGYVYRLWTVVAPKISANLMGASDEVRDMNIFRDFWRYNREGEIAAKLLIPFRQIEYVTKLNSNLDIIWQEFNSNFVQPESICNLLEEIT